MVTLNCKYERLLIVGATGELGSATVQASSNSPFWRDKKIYATYFRHVPTNTHPLFSVAVWNFLDLNDHESIRRLLLEISPTSVICCSVPSHQGASSQYTNFLRQGIVENVVALAEASKMIGARFIAVSTDQVFDGKLKNGRYKEDDPIRPTNPYASCKAEMEEQLLRLGGDILICRTSLVLTLEPPGKAVRFILDALEPESNIEIFTDELRNMSFSEDLGSALCEVSVPGHPARGLLHLCSDEPDEKNIKTARSAASKQFRPLNLSLDNSKAKSLLRTEIRGISKRLAQLP
ncbi:dTDP-4-dehydrorhamnose reductase [Galdieria sulphuraria]|nr:dTDP-4-dehydrorhamnose reductase [Galdieria sulphuraria]